jgi:hypothetical protein
LIKPVQVAIDTDERLLHEILSPFPIPNRPVDEIQEALVIPVHQLSECPGLPVQKCLHDLAVRELPQGL